MLVICWLFPQFEKRLSMFRHAVNYIFERVLTMSHDRLMTISRRDARQFLRELPEIHPFVEAYVMMFSFDGHTMPMDERMAEFLKEEDVLDPETTLEEAQKFVEHHLKVEECYDLYSALRQVAAEEKKTTTKKK
jgi:hypothetical protein